MILNSTKLGYGICDWCGKEFKREKKISGRGYKERKFCSVECENAHHRKMSEDRYGWGICKVCGKKFKKQRKASGYYSNSVFCSSNCKNKYADEKYPNRIKYCRFCGKRVDIVFRKNGEDRHYDISDFCNRECENNYYREIFGRLNCKMCGKLFYRECYVNSKGYKEYKRDRFSFYCKDCQQKLPKGYSKAELEFAKLLTDNNIQFDLREYRIDNFWYDFKISNFNILIDLNPSYTHSTEDTIFGSGKNRTYHYDRVETAVREGFLYICIWDWSDVDYKLGIIRQGIEKGKDYKFELVFHKQPKLIYNLKDTNKIFETKPKDNNVYLPIYNCGDYMYKNICDVLN